METIQSFGLRLQVLSENKGASNLLFRESACRAERRPSDSGRPGDHLAAVPPPGIPNGPGPTPTPTPRVHDSDNPQPPPPPGPGPPLRVSLHTRPKSALVLQVVARPPSNRATASASACSFSEVPKFGVRAPSHESICQCWSLNGHSVKLVRLLTVHLALAGPGPWHSNSLGLSSLIVLTLATADGHRGTP